MFPSGSLKRWAPVFAIAAASALAGGCGGGEPTGSDGGVLPGPDESEAFYAPDHLVEVAITLDPADWDALRMQTRDLFDILSGECLAEPFPSPFTYFAGTVNVDGTSMANVGVRKKGFLGSLSETKPSLKIKFDEYVMDAELFGLDRITLNNSRQDPSYLHQCISYEVFAAAGVPTPRCNFAHVTVNGEDMGLYVNVEGPDKEFLRRWFDDDEGNLYEGTLSDFRDMWVDTFDKKTNELDPDRSDLDLVVAAADEATITDANLAASLATIIDLDEFLTEWAVEVVTMHWDGYASDTNNFYVYDDPTSGLFHFIPWGTDGAFQSNPFAAGLPTSVFATGYLARRLYLADETRAMYLAKLRDVLDSAWDEAELLGEIDRMEALITPAILPADRAAAAASMDELRTVVSGRRAAILAEIDAGDPVWTEPLRTPPCFNVIGDVNGNFDTTWDTLQQMNAFTTGTGSIAGTLSGAPLQYTAVGSASGEDPNAAGPNATIQLVGLKPDGTIDVVVVQLDPAWFFAGAVIPLDWGAGFGGLWNYDPVSMAVTPIGYIMNGTITLNEAVDAAGAPVSGSFQGQLVSF